MKLLWFISAVALVYPTMPVYASGGGQAWGGHRNRADFDNLAVVGHCEDADSGTRSGNGNPTSSIAWVLVIAFRRLQLVK
jgi:hypothetical protein